MKTMTIEAGFYILITDDESGWLTVLPEGPWETSELAQDFLTAEVGGEGVVVYINSDRS